jgi:hypothetical protein
VISSSAGGSPPGKSISGFSLLMHASPVWARRSGALRR